MENKTLVPCGCQVCGKTYMDEEPEFCCSGLAEQCYCMGQPINGPFVCSPECYAKYSKPNASQEQEGGV